MKKETRGRKALPEKEKKKPIFIMIKGKFIKEVKPKLKEIEREPGHSFSQQSYARKHRR